jgi:competence protein ComGC
LYFGGLIFFKELKMLLVCLLVISLVLLFAFSMSREKGKNTKFARKGANALAQKRKTAQSIDTSEVIEIN